MKNEKRAIKEVFNVLNEHTEKLYSHLDFDQLLQKEDPKADSKKSKKVTHTESKQRTDDLEQELETLR